MIKNPKILEALERQSKQATNRQDWYKNADALYDTAMILNPDAVKRGGRNHVEMLISVREKLKLVQKNQYGAK